jgi:hypothetical protein
MYAMERAISTKQALLLRVR